MTPSQAPLVPGDDEIARARSFGAKDFAQAYVTHGNVAATAAALQVGEGLIRKKLHDPAVQAAVTELRSASLTAAQITATRVMLELGRVAFFDPRKLYDHSTGDMVPIHELGHDTAAAISSIKTDKFGEVTVKTADKMSALGLLARHFKLVGDEGDGVNALASALADRLNTAKRRVEPVQDVDYVDVPQQSPADDYPDDLT